MVTWLIYWLIYMDVVLDHVIIEINYVLVVSAWWWWLHLSHSDFPTGHKG